MFSTSRSAMNRFAPWRRFSDAAMLQQRLAAALGTTARRPDPSFDAAANDLAMDAKRPQTAPPAGEALATPAPLPPPPSSSPGLASVSATAAAMSAYFSGGGTAIRGITERLVLDPLSASADTARIPVNVASYLVARELVLKRSTDAGRRNEAPTEAMTLEELLQLRDALLGSTASYLLARSGAFALDAYLAECMPEFRADLSLSNDDHVTLVSDSRREVLFSCRGTDRMCKLRERRDVLAYWAIIRCRKVDPKDHSRLENTLREARQAYARYVLRQGYSFKLIGHSFGGFAATVCAQEMDCHAINFNGPVYRPLDGISLATAEAAAAVDAALEAAVDAAVDTAVLEECGTESADVLTAPEAPVVTDVPAVTLPPPPAEIPIVAVAATAPVPAAAAAATAAVPAVTVEEGGDQAGRRIVKRRGHVHHVQLGNDVVSLVGGALPHECERYTRLRHAGGPWDVAGAHLRYNIIAALDREARAAAAREGADASVVEALLRPCPDCARYLHRRAAASGAAPGQGGEQTRRPIARRVPHHSWPPADEEQRVLLIAP